MNTAKQLETNTQPLIVKGAEAETIRALGSEITFLHREPDARSMIRVSAPRGVGAPPHDHDFAESYYVMSGVLRVTVDAKEVTLGVGDFVHIPGGTVHGFKAISDAPTQFLIVASSGEADEFFRACARELTKLPDDLVRVPELAERYGIRVAPLVCSRQAR